MDVDDFLPSNNRYILS